MGPHVRLFLLRRLRQLTPPEQAAIITSPTSTGYNQALDYLRPHGTLVAVGLPPDTYISANVRPSPPLSRSLLISSGVTQVFWTVFKALRIVGSYVGNRQDAIEALDLAARVRRPHSSLSYR